MRDYIKISAFLEQCQFPHPFPLGHTINANPESVSSLTEITHNLQVTINFKKENWFKNNNKKWEQPQLRDGNSTSVYIVPKTLNQATS